MPWQRRSWGPADDLVQISKGRTRKFVQNGTRSLLHHALSMHRHLTRCSRPPKLRLLQARPRPEAAA